jgi:hypothetical protein
VEGTSVSLRESSSFALNDVTIIPCV